MKISTLILIISFLYTALACAETPHEQPSFPHEVASQTSEGVISGRVMIKGKTPMKNGVVLIFNKDMGPPPHPYNYWRIPDFINGTDLKGNFSVAVPEGTYYLMIAQKKGNGEIGPPKEKELLYFHGNSLENAKPIVVTAGSKVNLGVLSKTIVWNPKMIAQAKGITAIEGIVQNLENKPVDNVVIFAYYTKEAIGRPAFVSDRTDKMGNFQLRLYDGGVYYLKVRGIIGGGKPQQGEYQSATKEFEAVEAKVAKGKLLKDVKLKVDRFSSKGGTEADTTPRIWENTGNIQNR